MRVMRSTPRRKIPGCTQRKRMAYKKIEVTRNSYQNLAKAQAYFPNSAILVPRVILGSFRLRRKNRIQEPIIKRRRVRVITKLPYSEIKNLKRRVGESTQGKSHLEDLF